jgi:hypothetical protein
MTASEGRSLIAPLLPDGVKDETGCATDIDGGVSVARLPHATQVHSTSNPLATASR